MIMANGYHPLTGEWNDSLTGDYLWSSVNTREATPDVTTPYTWSAMRFRFSQMNTLCEDMDLSLRAAMQGWRCVFVPDVAVPQEEPEHIAHIKSQHGRWAKGGAQCLRKLSLPLLRSKLSPVQKMGGLMYLSGYAAHLIMLIVIVLWLPLALQPELFKQMPLAFLGFGGLGLPIEYVVAQFGLHGKGGDCRVNRAGCFDRCDQGPVCVVYPDAVWYTYVDEADIDEIVESHLRDGEPVARLQIK